MMFSLSDEQQHKLDEWVKPIYQKILESRGQSLIDDPLDSTEPNYGTIGGGLTYSFTPTSLGVIVKVSENLTGDTIDLTDYESW